MRKLGLLTLNGNTNYGNRLQNYAAQSFLENFGYKIETIKYKRDITGEVKSKSIIEKLKRHFIDENIISYINLKLNRIINHKNIEIEKKLLQSREANFQIFSEKYIHETNYTLNQNIVNDLQKKEYLEKEYDSFFIGSDQVWNLDGENFSDFYFLPFVSKQKRNAFSASFGIKKIPLKYESNYKKMLNGLNNISVREDSAQKIIKELTGKDSELLLDPTFLLSQTEWSKIMDPCSIKGEYILTYFLGRKTAEYQKIIELFSKKENIKVVSLNDIKFPNYYTISPDKFLALIKGASFVLTDSFHGVAFSIVYRKPFMAVDRVDLNINMNTRIISILNQFNLSNRYYKGGAIKTISWMNIDYKNADKVIQNNKKVAVEFVNNSLSAVSDN